MSAQDIQLNDPQTLYRRWEDSQWSPFEIVLSADQAQWDVMTAEDQGLIYWVLASLMVAEELLPSVAEALAAPDREGVPSVDALGVGTDEIREFALGGLTRRLDIIGMPLSSL